MAATAADKTLFAKICGRGLFIGGKFVPPRLRGVMSVIDPASEQVLTRCPAATAEDVDAAVKAARAAFPAWRRTSGADRAVYLRAIATGVRGAKDELSRMEAIDAGKPLAEAEWDIDDVADCFDYYAEHAKALDHSSVEQVDVGDAEYACSIRQEPVGVVGAIVPWNYPLLMATWKVAAALAAGCTVVLKPSEITPLTTMSFAGIVASTGLPEGVLNIVPGTGPDAGGPLVTHRGVDKVAFTGSVPTGSRIMGACAPLVRPVSLELGGKSAAIVFPDADLDTALEWVMFGCFWTNGQICSATSRLLIHESVADAFVAKLAKEAGALRCGNPLDPRSQVGPLSSEGQFRKVLGFIKRAQEEGAVMLSGGGRPEGMEKGYYVQPTVFDRVTPDMEIWQEEVFGPVLSIVRFSTAEEALALANDSRFGLAAAVFSQNKETLETMTRELEVGIVWTNCSQPAFCQMPWTGRKESGFGSDLGYAGLKKYLQPKSVTARVVMDPLGWYFQSKL